MIRLKLQITNYAINRRVEIIKQVTELNASLCDKKHLQINKIEIIFFICTTEKR